MLTVPGNISKIEKGQSYMMEQAVHHNLQYGLLVNNCCVTPKASRVPVILINTTDQNIWVRQTLLVAELFQAEVEPQQYHTEFNHEGNEITISFLLAHPHEGQEQVGIVQWRWKKIQIHHKKIISQWNTQSLGKSLTLGWPMI